MENEQFDQRFVEAAKYKVNHGAFPNRGKEKWKKKNPRGIP